MSFKEAAIESSNQYLSVLPNIKNGGEVTYNVLSFHQDKVCNFNFYLKPNGKIKYLDNIKIKIRTHKISENDVTLIDYDDVDNILKISVSQKELNNFLNSKAEDIILYSDLKFLIENVAKFYENYGDMLSFPESKIRVPFYDDKKLPDTPSDEQKAAATGALSNPLTYIWGAPGTGKTRFVLARCVISYIKQNENAKILLVAPTNNAVEQMLMGVLPVFESCGIEAKKVFRKGLPSSKFAHLYPDCCEFYSANQEAEKLEKKINEASKKINLLNCYKNYLVFSKGISDFNSYFSNVFANIADIVSNIQDYKSEIKAVEAENLLFEDDIKELKKKKISISQNIEDRQSEIDKYSSGFRKYFFKKKANECREKLRTSLKKFESIKNEIEKKSNTIKYNKIKVPKIKSAIVEEEARFKEYSVTLKPLAFFWKSLHKLVSEIDVDNFDKISKHIQEKITKGFSVLEEKKSRYVDFQNLSSSEIDKEIEDKTSFINKLSIELNSIKEQTAGVRMSNCNVLAATIDTAILGLKPNIDFKPDHIFLDESGYCPLVKGATLLAYNCPLTLLGDHMQMPPVCVVDDKDMKSDNRIIALFAQSALYIEDIVKDKEIIIDNYLNRIQPDFKILVKYTLNHTFRFGQKLAKVLADNIYTPDFHGSAERETKIYYINSPKINPERQRNKKDRYSISEIENIYKYVKAHPDENIGVITPYKKTQKKRLTTKLSACNVDVFTVHASQGQEWDTVLLSVVDVTNKFFTETSKPNSKGKQIINTAVSRVKNKLIIVCEATHWLTQKNQLICKLLEIAEEIKMDEDIL